MGLGVVVGMLADLFENDPEEVVEYRKELAAVNGALMAHGLPAHTEPEACDVWDADGYGYSGLHALTQVAGLHWQGKPIPRDVTLDGSQSDASQALFDAGVPFVEPQQKQGLMARVFGKGPSLGDMPPFIHLSVHGDSAGYYVPQDFAAPVMPKTADDDWAHLWPVGSVPRLESELNVLAGLLGMPADMGHDDDALAAALEQPTFGDDAPLWQVQPIAAYSCAVLRDACKQARKSGAAIVYS